MEAVLSGLENTAVAEFLRVSRWGYAGINALHIFGIALLVGAVVPLNLRLLGLWSGVPHKALASVLAPVAVTGLALAVTAGVLLFSVRAQEYSRIGFLQTKLVLVALGTLSAIALWRAHGVSLEGATKARLIGHALVSMVCWLGALISGRLIAFADG